MPILVMLFIVPLALWDALPLRWQPPVENGLIVAGILLFIFMVIRLIRTQLSYRADRMQGARLWVPALNALEYRGAVSLFLRQRGWHIAGGDTPDDDHVILRLSKEKMRAVLLFLKPSAQGGNATDMLDRTAQDFHATRAAVISASVRGERMRMTGRTSTYFLTFSDLDRLDEIFGTR